ncbi:hypothetical protein PWT90_06020 [Aphanocladium album]|nr:hypothetical protein PWT90_06020 [Aphanocladium album]
MSSSERFSATSNVLHVLAGYIHNRRLLFNLCLVNKQFNEAFSRKLWRRVEFLSKDIFSKLFKDESKWLRLLNSSKLRHGRGLVIWRGKRMLPHAKLHEDWEDDSDEEVANLNAAIISLIQHMPNLTSFAAYSIKLRAEVFDQLSKYKRLDSLVVQFEECFSKWLGLRSPHSALGNASTRQHHFVLTPKYLTNFKHLKRLSLLRLWGKTEDWPLSIMQVLAQSPGLQHLALSLSRNTAEFCMREENNDKPVLERSPFGFFSNICKNFGERVEERLQLQSLRLDGFIGLPDVATLECLTCTSHLKDLHFFNINPTRDSSVVTYESEYLAACPALEHMSCTEIDPDTWDNIAFIVTEDGQQPRPGVAISTAMCLHVFGPPKNGHGTEDCKEDPGASTDRLPSEEGIDGEFRPNGPGIRHGETMTHIAVAVENALWDAVCEREIVAQVLGEFGELPILEALWLVPEDRLRHLKPRTPEQEKLMHLYVRETARVCRQLRYLRVGDAGWRIRAEGDERILDALDLWEDRVECPDAFYSPKPLSWSRYVQHVEDRDL